MNFLKNHSRYLIRKYFRDSLAQLKNLEKIKPDSALLKTMRSAVVKLPFYKNIGLNNTTAIHNELQRFPIIRKADLLNKNSRLYPRSSRHRLFKGQTSGTTGSPLVIYRSYESILFENAFIRRHWALSGFKTGMERATLRGDIIVPLWKKKPPFWFLNKYDNQLIVSTRHIKREYIHFIADKIDAFSPFFLEAYPSAAYEMARLLESEGRVLHIPYIYTGSEMLYPHQRETIQKQFSGRVMDFYGMAERVAFFTECTHGNLHVNTDYSYIEILDKSGYSTDNLGYVTGTTYHNQAMPLVRYQLTDMTKWKKGKCPCGCNFPMVDPIQGKFEDIIYGGKGDPVSPSVLTFAFKGLNHISRSQVAQINTTTWEIRIVPYMDFSKQESRKLIENIKTMVDRDIHVKIKLVDDIPKTRAGKFRWIINETEQLCS